ncbi:MAG: CoA transferase [Dehalococcoidia bacterium]
MLLRGYRVLDLTDGWGILAGKLLADLGAEVIAVELPTGNKARRLEPYLGGDQAHSLYWLAYAAGKRGITLALDGAQGQALLRRLLAVSDVLLESFRPGHMVSLGLAYELLREENPSLVACAVTPFGQYGPYSQYLATDLTIMAAGGLVYLTGDEDRPPVRISFPQASLIAASAAAAGVAIALFHRTRTGEGQFIDVSVQHAVARSLDRAATFWDIQGTMLSRSGSQGRPGGGTLRRMTWECQDGYLAFFLLGGMSGARNMKALAQWMRDTGFDPGPVQEIRWDELDFFAVPQEVLVRVSHVIERFLATFTKEEAWRQAQRRRLLLYPVSEPGEVYEHTREIYPDFFHPIPHPELGKTLEYLGPFLPVVGDTTSTARAPALGEHNDEVYGELLGLSPLELRGLRQGGLI